MSQELVHIGNVIVNGILFDPKNTQAWRNMGAMENIYQAVPRLFDLLDERGVDYVLVGGIAMLVYIEGRNTQDIDLIIARDDLKKVPEIRIEDVKGDFARGWFGDLRMDFLFTDSKLFDTVRKQHVTTRRFTERDAPCVTVEGLLLLKLFALPSLYRQAQFDKVRIYESDVAGLIATYHPSMTPLFDELAKHMLASDVDEVRRIVADIEDRIARQSQRFNGGG